MNEKKGETIGLCGAQNPTVSLRFWNFHHLTGSLWLLKTIFSILPIKAIKFLNIISIHRSLAFSTKADFSFVFARWKWICDTHAIECARPTRQIPIFISCHWQSLFMADIQLCQGFSTPWLRVKVCPRGVFKLPVCYVCKQKTNNI